MSFTSANIEYDNTSRSTEIDQQIEQALQVPAPRVTNYQGGFIHSQTIDREWG